MPTRSAAKAMLESLSSGRDLLFPKMPSEIAPFLLQGVRIENRSPCCDDMPLWALGTRLHVDSKSTTVLVMFQRHRHHACLNMQQQCAHRCIPVTQYIVGWDHMRDPTGELAGLPAGVGTTVDQSLVAHFQDLVANCKCPEQADTHPAPTTLG